MDYPHVVCICATCGRHTVLERSVRLFLEQDYKGHATLLIYNNSDIDQELNIPFTESNRDIILINNHISRITSEPFRSLGEIYNYIIKEMFNFKDDVVACFWDDDDLFLPNHISEGVNGLRRGKKIAYKPKKSYYRSSEGVSLMENNLEPSIFLKFSWLRKYGFSLTTTEQHLQWLNPLEENNEIFVDPNGVPTLIYNWGDTNIATFKTSGDFHNPNNFQNYKKYSQDHGDRIITPISKEEVQQYLKI
jgi:hypothetical protein